MFPLVALDIGGTRVRTALADHHGRILQSSAELTCPTDGPQRCLDRIAQAIRKTTSGIGCESVASIVVGAAGPIDIRTGTVLTPPSLPTWHNTPIKKRLEDEFGVPVWVENDADLAALGESRFGAGQGFDRLIYITVSTGIGGGIIANGQLLRGAGISVAEIGHMIVDPDGPQCNCGAKGHVEPLASGTAIARMAIERITDGRSSVIPQLVSGNLSAVTAETVVTAARQGDTLANEVMRDAGTSLGLAVVSLLHIFDPELVIIGGGVSNAGDLLLNPVRAVIAERAMPDFRGRAKVVRSALGDHAGIMGAVAYALERTAASC